MIEFEDRTKPGNYVHARDYPGAPSKDIFDVNEFQFKGETWVSLKIVGMPEGFTQLSEEALAAIPASAMPLWHYKEVCANKVKDPEESLPYAAVIRDGKLYKHGGECLGELEETGAN